MFLIDSCWICLLLGDDVLVGLWVKRARWWRKRRGESERDVSLAAFKGVLFDMWLMPMKKYKLVVLNVLFFRPRPSTCTHSFSNLQNYKQQPPSRTSPVDTFPTHSVGRCLVWIQDGLHWSWTAIRTRAREHFTPLEVYHTTLFSNQNSSSPFSQRLVSQHTRSICRP